MTGVNDKIASGSGGKLVEKTLKRIVSSINDTSQSDEKTSGVEEKMGVCSLDFGTAIIETSLSVAL